MNIFKKMLRILGWYSLYLICIVIPFIFADDLKVFLGVEGDEADGLFFAIAFVYVFAGFFVVFVESMKALKQFYGSETL